MYQLALSIKRYKTLVLFFFFLLIAFGGYYFFIFSYCPTHVSARSEFGKSPVLDAVAVDQGYTLFSPFVQDQFVKDSGVVYLVDLYGMPVHTWKTKYQTLYSSLKKNGNLVVSMIKPGDLLKNPGGGGTGLVQELDWKGNVLWEYENNLIHHDFEVLPNGDIAFLIWEKMPVSLAEKIQGGSSKEGSSKDESWADGIIEVDRDGKIVWSWHSYEHLNPEKYTLGAFTPRNEWTHANSVRYFESNPLNGKAGFLVSLRHLNEVVMIDKESGDAFWESPKGVFSYQHDATLLSNGHVLGFDNGLFRSQERPFLWSRVIEIDPLSNKIVWEFNGGKTGPEKAKFAASIMSGAQRLQNGDTLIIDTLRGHLVETTSDNRIVWDFVNPFTSVSTGPFENNIVFKARRYSPQEINWPEKISPPLPKTALLCR